MTIFNYWNNLVVSNTDKIIYVTSLVYNSELEFREIAMNCQVLNASSL